MRRRKRRFARLFLVSSALWFGTTTHSLAQMTPAAHGAAEPPNVEASAAELQHKARACFDAAQAAYLAGQLDEALRGFGCAFALQPSAELAWNLARVAERMGDVEKGVRYYQEYLTRSEHVGARERRQVEARIQALRELAARQASAIKAQPDLAGLSKEARVFFERGVKLYRRGQYASASAAFGAALQLSNAPELRYNLALTSERLGQKQDACDHYLAYLAAAPDAPDQQFVNARVTELRAELP
jgi:tetratricopeptide (TPR) repeat protein